MKTYNNLFNKIINLDNLRLAHAKAQKGKQHYSAVKRVNKNPDKFLKKIRKNLATGRFKTSSYVIQPHLDGKKWRMLHKLPYYPDRIVQHAVMNVCIPIWKKGFIRDTFQSIEGRGTHDARKRINKFLVKNPNCHAVKLDIKQYYPSICNNILKSIVSIKIKCKQTLWLLYNIIDSCKGLPIGNFSSQYLGNLYLNLVDWWAKQTLKIKGYFRYCDDIVLIHKSSLYLSKLVSLFKIKLADIKLKVKDNVQYRFIPKQGLDFCGFVFYGNYTKLRKDIAYNLKHCIDYKDGTKTIKSLMSYWGWVKAINAKSMWKTLITTQVLKLTDNIYKNNPLRKTIYGYYY